MANHFMGIDVSKGYADFIVLDADKEAVDAGFQLDDTAAGHEKLMAYLNSFFARYPEATLYTAVESTGGYEDNWYNRLHTCTEAMPLHVARINPAWVKSNSEANGRRNKTDAISAKDIALYLIEHPQKVRYNENKFPTLRRQWTVIRMFCKQKTQLINQLESQLYSSMPELLTFCRQGMPMWLLKLLTRYPSYQAVLQAGIAGLSQIAFISEAKAEKVIARIKHGIGHCDQMTEHVLKNLVGQIINTEKIIQQQKRFLEKHYQEARHEVELLLTFTGIGVYSAIGLLMNIVDIHRFPTAKHLASYFGLHPIFKMSGDGSWGMHMSKQGRSEPRAILYMVAFSAIQYNPVIKELYARCLAKGMHKSAALGVCMHKILRIVYGMLKNNTPFDPNIERTHRQKHYQKRQQQALQRARRLQQFDKNAPISRRQRKRRKEQTQSQDEVLVVYGMAEPAPSGSLMGGT